MGRNYEQQKVIEDNFGHFWQQFKFDNGYDLPVEESEILKYPQLLMTAEQFQQLKNSDPLLFSKKMYEAYNIFYLSSK